MLTTLKALITVSKRSLTFAVGRTWHHRKRAAICIREVQGEVGKVERVLQPLHSFSTWRQRHRFKGGGSDYIPRENRQQDGSSSNTILLSRAAG